MGTKKNNDRDKRNLTGTESEKEFPEVTADKIRFNSQKYEIYKKMKNHLKSSIQALSKKIREQFI